MGFQPDDAGALKATRCRIPDCRGIADADSSLCFAHILSGRAAIEQFYSLGRSRFDLRGDRWTYLYAMRADEYVKFGVADDAQIRLRQLQIGCPHKLELLGVVTAKRLVEEVIHRIAVDESVHGEWYRLRGIALSLAGAIQSKDYAEIVRMTGVHTSCVGVEHVADVGTQSIAEAEKKLRAQLTVEQMADATKVGITEGKSNGESSEKVSPVC